MSIGDTVHASRFAVPLLRRMQAQLASLPEAVPYELIGLPSLSQAGDLHTGPLHDQKLRPLPPTSKAKTAAGGKEEGVVEDPNRSANLEK